MTSAATIPTTLTRDSLVDKSRIASIDIMRGIVMVIMALDHTRDFYHETTGLFDPTDLTKTNPILFFTRIITHFCAPTFVFLSGVSAYISTQKKPLKELSVFLFTRGLWLVFLEFTVVRFGIVFNLYYDFIIFQVIWVIGASMIVLAGLIYLPQRIILIVGLVLVFGHNLLDLVRLTPEDTGYLIWGIIQQAGSYSSSSGQFYLMAYPLVPWLGIMLTGYGAGFLYNKNYDAVKRKNILMYSGIAAIILFALLRFTNIYGDLTSWSTQKNGMFTFMSFLNVTKYPVSLQYTLMTLGPVLIIMARLENVKTNIFEPMRIIGRVPLFYYILHFYLIHFSSLCIYMITTGTAWSDIDFHFPKTFGGIPAGVGYSLVWVYVAWISIVVVLYPFCRWYHHYKSTRRYWWLGYL